MAAGDPARSILQARPVILAPGKDRAVGIGRLEMAAQTEIAVACDQTTILVHLLRLEILEVVANDQICTIQ